MVLKALEKSKNVILTDASGVSKYVCTLCNKNMRASSTDVGLISKL